MKKEAQTISREEYSSPSMQYRFLLQQGISYAQKFSGGIWTDYNHHDPGVTFLEQLCYALTDLGYRTQFDIQDILLHGTDSFDTVSQNALFGPSRAFPCDPFTVIDYRRLLIDRVKLVRNAWVTPVKDDPAGYQGLYRILVQCREDMRPEEKAAVSVAVSEVFHSHRNFCHDLKEVVLMEEDVISFSGRIFLAPDGFGELVLAQITARLDQFLNPEVALIHPESLLESGRRPEEVFEGPLPMFGYIDPGALPPRVSAIYISQIRDLILETEGVLEIEDLVVYKNGIRVYDDAIAFEENRFPVVWNKLEAYAGEWQRFHFMKDQVSYEIDPVSALQLFQSLSSSTKGLYLKRIKYEESPHRGTFPEREIQAYYSIQRELPDTYGLTENSLPSAASARRRAQASQLKAYLVFFEQIMANYLAQLSHTRKLFSIDDNSGQTYYYQIPEDIPVFEQLLPGVDKEAYKQALHQIHAELDNYPDRRKRMLAHLLARFGERFPGALLQRFSFRQESSESKDTDLETLDAMARVLTHVIPLNRHRALGFNYTSYSWGTNNISGIEWRICLNTNIADAANKSVVSPLSAFTTFQPEPEPDQNWLQVQLEMENGQVVEARSLHPDAYVGDSCIFYTEEEGFLKDIFLAGTMEHSYYGATGAGLGWPGTAVVFQSPSPERIPTVIYWGQNQLECREVIEKTIQRFQELNKRCEGFHIVEHLLLRPLEPVHFRVDMFDSEGEVLLSSHQGGTYAQQRDLADDIPFLGSKREHYSILPDNNSGRYQVFLYNSLHEPIARLNRSFYVREDAEMELERALDYISRVNLGFIGAEEVIEVTQESGLAQQFPDNFEFSHEYSLLFPDWPARFQNGNFKKLLRQILDEHGIAHQKGNIYFLQVNEMSQFEETYEAWLQEKSRPDRSLAQLDLLSLELVQLLSGLKQAQVNS